MPPNKVHSHSTYCRGCIHQNKLVHHQTKSIPTGSYGRGCIHQNKLVCHQTKSIPTGTYGRRCIHQNNLVCHQTKAIPTSTYGRRCICGVLCNHFNSQLVGHSLQSLGLRIYCSMDLLSCLLSLLLSSLHVKHKFLVTPMATRQLCKWGNANTMCSMQRNS